MLIPLPAYSECCHVPPQVCNHPYLVKNVEDQITANVADPAELAQLFMSASGKFVLLDKLLPKLKSGGHRVLIFSQMVRVLDLLADFLRFRRYAFERLDGGIRGHERQVRVLFPRPAVELARDACVSIAGRHR